MLKGIISIILLIISNAFMTFAWYGHLQKKNAFIAGLGIIGAVLFSWGLAFFEYIFQVPANRIGFENNGGPFTLFQLKIIQEVLSLTVFTIIAVYIFKSEKLQWNYLVGFAFMVLAVFFVFKKW